MPGMNAMGGMGGRRLVRVSTSVQRACCSFCYTGLGGFPTPPGFGPTLSSHVTRVAVLVLLAVGRLYSSMPCM